ncbi:MAG: efflux RND transporter permease subunit [Pirellulales bacterium]
MASHSRADDTAGGLPGEPGGGGPAGAGTGVRRDPSAFSQRPGWRSPSWRAPALAAVLICSALAAWGISRLRIDDDLRALLRGRASDFAVIDEIASRFGSPDRDCIVRATAAEGDLFSNRALDQLRTLCADLREIPGVEEVRSILDIRRHGAAGGLLPVIPRSHEPLPAEALTAARDRAARHPLIAGHMLSADTTSTLVLVRLAAGDDTPARAAPVLARIEESLAAATGPLRLELTGLPPLRHAASAALRRDMLIFNTTGLCLAVILSAAVAGSLRSTLVACIPPTIGAIWAMGMLGLCGAEVNILTSVVPSLALVVGTCDSIHFIEDMRRSARRGVDPVRASAAAIGRVGVACGLTSIVTAVGFASLAAARIDAVRTFGISAAAGAVASFLAVSLVTPLLASTRFCSGMRLGKSSRSAGRAAALVAAFAMRHARPVAAVGCLALAALALVSSGVDADTRVVDALPRSAPASRALVGVDREFGGAMGVDVMVRWPEGLDWTDDGVVTTIGAVHHALAADEGPLAAVSLASVVEPLPERARRRLDPNDFRDLVDADARTAVVRARVRDLGSRRLEGVYDRIDDRLSLLAADHPGWRFQLAGMSVVSARNIRQLIRDLGSSLLLELAVIGSIIAFAFRSPLVGAISLIPNVFPLAAIGAVVVASGSTLEPATVIVFNVCLGLAVDDTVHVLAALRRHRRAGLSMTGSLRRAIAETGNAIVIGGVVLAVGFATVMVSSVPSLSGFGRLACAAVAAATAAELMLLPALVLVVDAAVRRWLPHYRDGIFTGDEAAVVDARATSSRPIDGHKLAG